ncbi:SidA/IucD/PvdA family monooxygenase [Thorsellia kenyensis]|uniref:SidA/IucD/PvdA family monooxygenase n=1 Tax=Thorsellia kenyensis TaxID=1549888 RepID=A0ABV6C8J8_9GAMM
MSVTLNIKEFNVVYDVIGIGFGPANLAIAAAIDDLNLTSENSYFLNLSSCFTSLITFM